MIRTGLFKYVPVSRIRQYQARGWMVVDDLGRRHGFYCVLMWRCDCKEIEE